MKNGQSNKPHVDLKTCRQITQARIGVQVAEAGLGEAQSKYNSVIARALAFVGAEVQTNLVCLNCGLVYPRTPPPEGQQERIAPCPECSKKKAKPSAQAKA